MVEASEDGLPYIDTHTVTVAAGADQVWSTLRAYVDGLGFNPKNPGARLLRTEPANGFRIAEASAPTKVVLIGRHRFSRYRLEFEVEARPEQRTTLLHAHSFAAFPGLHGRAYRALVIGTRLHVVATTGLLRQIRSRVGQPRT